MMANTKISDLTSKETLICSGECPLWMYGWFKDYGSALNYCIKNNIDIKKIKSVWTPPDFLIPDFYSIEGVEPQKVIIIDPCK